MKIRRQFFPYLALCIPIVLAGSPIFASTSATITGRVTDQQDLVVPGAQVQATNIQTNITYAGETNEDGLYRIPNLPPGEYRLIIQKDGFASIAKPGLELHVQDIITLNFSMQIGSVTQTVTVESGAPLVRTESGSVGTVIDRRFVERLPLNGRSFNTLLQLTPGVVIAPVRASGDGGQFSTNGQRTNSNYFTVDGVSANFGITFVGGGLQSGSGAVPAFNAYGGTSSLVSVDAMQEFRIETSTFAPEFGRTPGGQVIISTRSGTNEFHGGIFDYFRNDKLDANDWFANAAGLPRAPNRQNDFGGFLGGPIARNKTFFFVSYEGLRLRLPQTRVTPVPALSVRSSAIPAAAQYLNAFPVPNGPILTSTTEQFTGVYSDRTIQDATSMRIDHQLGRRLALFGRFNYAPSSNEIRQLNSLNSVQTQITDTKTLTLGSTVSLGPALTNSFRANYSTQDSAAVGRLDSFGKATPPNLDVLIPPPLSVADVFSSFSPTGLPPLVVGPTSDNRTRQINFVNDFSLSKGTHQIKLGIDYRNLLYSRGPFFSVFYSIASLQTFAATASASIAFSQSINAGKVSFSAWSAYGQDSWKMASRLTVTYGLRWEFNPVPSGQDGTLLAAWRNVEDPPNTSLAPMGTPLWKNRYDNFAPRVGLSYQLTSGGDLVLRGGWGLFYDLGSGIVPRLTGAFPNTATRLIVRPTLPIAMASAITPPQVSLQPPFPATTEGFSPNLKLPWSQQWNVSLEKSIAGQQVVSLTYVAQIGRELLRRERRVRPNGDFPVGSNFFLNLNADTSDYHALQVQYRRPLSRRIQALANYTWSHSIDTSSDDVTENLTGLVISAQTNRANSSFDVRHNFSASITYDLPHLPNRGFLSQLTRDWSVDAIVQARAAFPITVSTGSVVIPGVSGSTRPDLVLGVPVWLKDSSAPGGKRLNPAAFALPPQPRQGTLGRNSIEGFGLGQIDFSVGRAFSITERIRLRFRSDFFNLLNHPNFANPNPEPQIVGRVLVNASSTQMLSRGLRGLSPLYQIGGPRSVQLSLKLDF
ncbi:MAG: TonB-dependent receptor [Acidobacteria bacterium]|nr:TonB-dependent receptor [Acidobacteriota bacterium]